MRSPVSLKLFLKIFQSLRLTFIRSLQFCLQLIIVVIQLLHAFEKNGCQLIVVDKLPTFFGVIDEFREIFFYFLRDDADLRSL